MNRICLVLIGLLSIYLAMVECKSSVQLSHHQHPRQRLKYRGVKKASFHKPNKSPKSIVDVFKGLPADDIEFIKQLDKQFEKFGNNVRIKIEKENRTTAKNSKRTIDSSLGYGYSSNQAEEESSYYFSKPKFQIYPYSQHDIAPTPQYQQLQQYLKHNQPQALVSDTVESQNYYQQSQNEHTSVEIQPSRSYELQETQHGYESLEQQDTAEYHHQALASQQPSVPVIVLRIPGPQKYASHLQALLQQYLEIRAAQYIQVLQQQEAQQLQQQQQLQSQSQQHQEQQPQPQLQQQQQAELQLNPGVDHHSSLSYASEGDSYLNRPVEVGQVYPAPAPVGLDQAYGVPPQPAFEQSNLPHEVPVETHANDQQSLIQADHSQHGQSAAFVYQALQDHAQQQEQIVYGGPRQPVENPLDHYGAPRQPVASSHLLTSENFPDDKHTQVIFRSTTQQPPAYHFDNSGLSSHLPDAGAVEVQTFRAPLVYQRFEQFYGSQPDYEGGATVNADLHAEHHHNGGLDDESAASPTPVNIVTITQRPVLPYNYHAQGNSQPNRFHSHYNGEDYPILQSNNLYKRSSAKRHAHPHPETPRVSPADRQRKFTNLMHRLKARVTQSTRYDTIPL